MNALTFWKFALSYGCRIFQYNGVIDEVIGIDSKSDIGRALVLTPNFTYPPTLQPSFYYRYLFTIALQADCNYNSPGVSHFLDL